MLGREDNERTLGDFETFEWVLWNARLMRELEPDIRCAAENDVNVLLTGRDRLTMELVARLIHERSRFCARAFVVIDCARQPEAWLLPGLTRPTARMSGPDAGVLSPPDPSIGTMFFRTVEQLTGPQQAQLLELVSRTPRPCPDEPRERYRDHRVIAAAGRDVLDHVESGTFRGDLFYRLNILHLSVPALVLDLPVRRPPKAGES